MLVEKLNPISEHLIQTSAQRDLTNFQSNQNYQVLIETVTKSTVAAVEVGGLAPTLAAAITSGFAVIHELPHPFWPTIVYVLILIAIALSLLVMLGGRSFFEIDDASFKIPLCRANTRTKIVSKTIYMVNGLFILLAVGVYLVLNYWPESTAVKP
jgi:hypothetical protein